MPALSTVALTAYNVIAVSGGARTLQQLLPVVPDSAHESVLQPALDELVRRGWVVLSDGAYDVADKKRRLVRERDRSDGRVLEDGTVDGGWGGWLVQCRRRGLIRIEDAIAEGA